MRKNKQNQGFTLAEVVIASSVLLMVLGGSLLGFVQATRLQYMADRNYSASVIGRNRIEHAKVFAYGSLSILTENNVCVDRNGDTCPTGTFWRTTSTGGSAANTNCTEMIVKVAYEIRPGVTSPVPVEISTIITE